MSKPFIVLGSGGHASVLLELLAAAGMNVDGVITIDEALHGKTFGGAPVIGGDDALDRLDVSTVALANGVGSVGSPTLRARLYDEGRARGFDFPAVVHPSAIVSPSAELADGAQIFAGSVIQCGARIGENALVNTAGRVDHHCILGKHVHLAPAAVLCGSVTIGDRSHIGAGAVVIQHVSVGRGVIVGAGAVVTTDVAEGVTVVGVPAREIVR